MFLALQSMSTEPRGTAGQAALAKKRKHTIKKFVFSSATKEAETPAPQINPESYQQPRLQSKSIGKTEHRINIERFKNHETATRAFLFIGCLEFFIDGRLWVLFL